jgi:hypothetical protein
MKVQELMTTTVPANESTKDAAVKMRNLHIGCLIGRGQR